MKNSTFLIAIAFLFIMPLLLLSQENSKKEMRKLERKARDKYLVTGFGGSLVKATDNATSPLMYKGFAPAVSINYLVHSEHVIKALETDFSYGWLSSRTNSPWYQQQNTSIIFNLRFYKLYQLKKIFNNKLNCYLGGEVFINNFYRINYKYGNSALNFESYAGLGPTTRFEFPFGHKARHVKIWFMNFNRRDRDLRLSFQASLPLVNFLVRPTYVTVTNFIDPELQSAITSDNMYGGFLIPFSVRTHTELYYILHNQNMLKLSYGWNFFSHDPGFNKVQTATHSFLFSYIFKFNYKTNDL
jgi:hypothetical protein